MVVFSTDYCPHCDRLKAEVLTPRLQQGLFKQRVRIREFNIDSAGKITDFDGDPIRGRIFVKRYNVFATPTVVLLDYSGNPLTSPLVGFNNREDYTDHLEEEIDSALKYLETSPEYVMENRSQ
jgi:thioredoxin-related protein